MTMNAQPTENALAGVGDHTRTLEIGLQLFVVGLLLVSVAGIAFVFGFDPNKGIAPNISPAFRAAAVDGLFYLSIYLSRRFWFFAGALAKVLAGFWFVIALGAAAFSWMANTLFVNDNHTLISQDLLNTSGYDWIHAVWFNQAIGAIPIIILLLYIFVPRRYEAKIETRTPEQIRLEAQQKLALIEAKNLLRSVESKGAADGVRTAFSSAANGLFKLDERNARKEQEAAAKAERKRLAEEKRAEQAQIKVLARTHGLVTPKELAEEEDMESDELDAWHEMLEARLRDKGLWPASVAALPDVETLQEVAIQQEEQEEDISDASLSATTPSGRHRTWMTDKEVMEFLGLKDIRTARRWMSAEYKGPYKIEGCMTRKHVRRAPIASVQAIRTKREHEAALVEQPVTQ